MEDNSVNQVTVGEKNGHFLAGNLEGCCCLVAANTYLCR